MGAEIGRSINIAMASEDIDREIARLSDVEARHVAEEHPARDGFDWDLWGTYLLLQFVGAFLLFTLFFGVIGFFLVVAVFTVAWWVGPLIAAVSAVAWTVARVNAKRKQAPAHAALIPIVERSAQDVVRARRGLRA